MIGTSGVAGADGDGTIPGANGTGGESVTFLLDAPDPANDGTAIGGDGGAGGASGGSPYTYGAGAGVGGVGGSSNAEVVSSSSTGDSSASAEARGGDGGAGGLEIVIFEPPAFIPYPIYAHGGDGGDARASSTTQSTAGEAFATANAQGGDGGSAGFGIASAEASALGAARAEATASGSQANGQSTATSSSADAVAISTASGVTTAASAAEATFARADAEARSLGAGSAEATAVATGGRSRRSPTGVVTGGTAAALARAFSDSGPATARATQSAGAPPLVVPRTDGYPSGGGGPGVDSVAVDFVSGSTAGLLTLEQTAIASDAGNAFRGGNARSSLRARNPGGGDVRADTFALGGDGGWNCTSRGISYCELGAGGNAVAAIEVVDPLADAIDARAHANAGLGGLDPAYYAVRRSRGGDAFANVSATGNGSVFALAEASAQLGSSGSASVLARGPGGIATVYSDVEVAAWRWWSELSPDPIQTVVAQAGIRAATQAPELPTVAHSTLFGRPHEADVASWVDGNPNAIAALGERDALALGSLGVAGGEGLYQLELEGLAYLELDETYFDEDATLALALLDPTGTLADAILHLSLRDQNGQVLFEQSLSGDAVDVDDVVVELGEIDDGIQGLSTYWLQWDVETGAGGVDFSLDFAFLGHAPVPEPSAFLLLALASFAGVLRRTRGSRRPPLA